jgi:filamentous hemagglutinin family protein
MQLLTATLVLVSLLGVSVSQGQTTSITSSGLNTQVTFNSGAPVPTYDITGGTRPGNGTNLFHSFGEFSVGTHDIARFGNDAGLPTTNILSRVTGGQASNIYGNIQSAGFGTAALWLINPAGIVFGPSASLNVGGSAHFSTADYLRLGSGNDRFYADLGKTSQLTSAAVAAFGFLNSNPAAIAVKGSNLVVPNGQTLSLVGGNHTFPDPVNPSANVPSGITMTGGSLSTPGGRINIVSVASAGEVSLNNSNGPFDPPTFVGFTDFGRVTLSQGANVDTSTNQRMLNPMEDVNSVPVAAGPIYIRAGQLVLDASSIKATSRGFVFKGDEANITTGSLLDSNLDDVRPGDISITADQFNLLKHSLIRTGSDPPSDLPLGYFSLGGAPPRVDAFIVQPGSIKLNVGTFFADTSLLDTGSSLQHAKAGRLNIQGIGQPAPEARLVNLQASTINDRVGLGSGSGTGGGVTISAREVLFDRLTYTGASGDASGSNFTIQSSDHIHIQNSTLTHPGIGGAGNITLSAGNEIYLVATTLQTTNEQTSTGARVTLTAPVITIQGGKILTDSRSSGAPPITFNVGDLNISALQAGTTIESALVSSSGLDEGNGNVGSPGAITVQGIGVTGSPPPPATHMVVNNSAISTTTISGGADDRTRISIRAQNIDLTNGAQVKADTSGAGPAGNIILNGGGAISLTNGAAISSSSTAILPQGGTPGPGDAGDITIVSGDSISVANSSVSTSATQASGGNIILTAPNIVRLAGANLTSSVAGPPGSNGGNITIDTAHPQFVVLQGNSQILARANAGQGGAITIIGGVVLQDAGSVLDATAGPAGISGTVNIQSPFQQLSGAIAPLPQAFVVATNLYGQRCAAEKGGQFSSFVQGARDGVPPQPGDLIPSPLMLEPDDIAFNRGAQSTPSLAAIRLGLPEFDQMPHSLPVFAGCRS